MKPILTISKKLLRELDKGFSYITLVELESICALYLKNDDPQNKLFYYALRQICFELKEYIDANQPIESILHSQIESAVIPSLKRAFNTFEGASIDEKVIIFNQLLIDKDRAKLVLKQV